MIICADCGKRVPKKEALGCATCNSKFCPKCFHTHENLYGVLIGNPCQPPPRSQVAT